MKKIIKIIIYAALAIILHLLSINVKSQSAARFLLVLEIILMVLILRIVVSLTENRVKFLAKKAKELLIKVFRPIIDKIKERYARRRKFVKGSDEKRLVFNFNIIEKLKNKLKLRKKLDLKHGASNIEKIRLLYIKFILILIENHYKVKYSHTPREIKIDLPPKEHDILFDSYEKARYGHAEYIAISDDVVDLCREAALHRPKRI